MQYPASTGGDCFPIPNAVVSADGFGAAPSLLAAHTDGQGRRLRVLLAEDHPLVRRLTTALLQRAGHEVIAVEDGLAAVAAVQRWAPDIALMDVQMPLMDGLTATRLIRDAERESGGHIPIIALTAGWETDERERGLEAGLDGFIEKPFDARVLLAQIERMVAGGGRGMPCGCEAVCEAPPFDRATVLDRIGGDEALLREMLEVFVQELPATLGAIDIAVATWDSEGVERNAHTLHGALLALSAAPAADAARALERVAGLIPAVAAILARSLRRELDHLVSAVTASLGSS